MPFRLTKAECIGMEKILKFKQLHISTVLNCKLNEYDENFV
jgi:hypothetical protein